MLVQLPTFFRCFSTSDLQRSGARLNVELNCAKGLRSRKDCSDSEMSGKSEQEEEMAGEEKRKDTKAKVAAWLAQHMFDDALQLLKEQPGTELKSTYEKHKEAMSLCMREIFLSQLSYGINIHRDFGKTRKNWSCNYQC